MNCRSVSIMNAGDCDDYCDKLNLGEALTASSIDMDGNGGYSCECVDDSDNLTFACDAKHKKQGRGEGSGKCFNPKNIKDAGNSIESACQMQRYDPKFNTPYTCTGPVGEVCCDASASEIDFDDDDFGTCQKLGSGTAAISMN